MSYSVQLNRKLPEQGVYDQIVGGHINNRKSVKLYPKSGSGPFGPQGQSTISFRLPTDAYIDPLRSYLTYDLTIVNLRNQGANIDNNVYLLGGTNGSSASPFRTFRILYDGEPLEYIDNYHGLAAFLSQNIPDSYRKNAIGSLQCFTSTDFDEACYDQGARFGCTQQQNDCAPEPQIRSATTGVTETGIIHMPLSGIMGNAKLLPTKFLGNIDVEFMLGSCAETIQVIGHGPFARYATRVFSNAQNQPQSMDLRGLMRVPRDRTVNPDGGFFPDPSRPNGEQNLLDGYTTYLLGGGGQYHYTTNRAGVPPPDVNILNLSNELISSSHYTYQIMNPIYHLEIVFMSEAYDAAFTQALTSGVTYAYETYTNTVSPMPSASGVMTIPISKTSIQSIYQGFIIDYMQNRITTNHWHFHCPDMTQWQLQFGAKYVPAEPVRLLEDGGLDHLMYYLKATNQHYNPLAGFAQHIVYEQDEYVPYHAMYQSDSYNWGSERHSASTDPYVTGHWDLIPRDFTNDRIELFRSAVTLPFAGLQMVVDDPQNAGNPRVLGTNVAILNAATTMKMIGRQGNAMKRTLRRAIMNSGVKNATGATTNIWGGGSVMMLRGKGDRAGTTLGNIVDPTDDNRTLRTLRPALNVFVDVTLDTDYVQTGALTDPVNNGVFSTAAGGSSSPSMALLTGRWIKKRPLAAGYQQARQLDVYSRYLGYWGLAIDVESEPSTVSGINTAGSSCMLQFHYIRDNENTAPTQVYTWVCHNKALRFEPFGNCSVIID